mgnify:CR=1 FL=1
MAPPLAHAKWNGWTFTDWIFPFFLFIVGLSMTLSLGARAAFGSPLTSNTTADHGTTAASRAIRSGTSTVTRSPTRSPDVRLSTA